MWYSTYQSKEVHTLLKILRRKQLFSLQLENAPAPMAIISPIGNLSLQFQLICSTIQIWNGLLVIFQQQGTGIYHILRLFSIQQTQKRKLSIMSITLY